MTTLTIEFTGVTEDTLNILIEKGYAKTKSEAVRYALLHVREEMMLNRMTLHERADRYISEEVLGRFSRLRKK